MPILYGKDVSGVIKVPAIIEASVGLRDAFFSIAREAKRFHVPPSLFNEIHKPAEVEDAAAIDLMPPFSQYLIEVDSSAYDDGWRPTWFEYGADPETGINYKKDLRIRGMRLAVYAQHYSMSDGDKYPIGKIVKRPEAESESLFSEQRYIAIEEFVAEFKLELEGTTMRQTIYAGGLFDIETRQAFAIADYPDTILKQPPHVQKMIMSVVASQSIGACKRAAAFHLLLNSREVRINDEQRENRAARKEWQRTHDTKQEPPSTHTIYIAATKTVGRIIEKAAAGIKRAEVPQHDVIGHKRTLRNGKVRFIESFTRCKDRPRKGTAEYDLWRMQQPSEPATGDAGC